MGSSNYDYIKQCPQCEENLSEELCENCGYPEYQDAWGDTLEIEENREWRPQPSI